MTTNRLKIETCPSTNAYLMEWAEKELLPEGTVVVTNNQTAGKGQRNNVWESQSGKNLTFSVLLYPRFLPLNQFFLLSEIISLGIKDALDIYTDGISIKWPNDIYYQNKKICGILIENEVMGQFYSQSVIGIGLNVNQAEFLSNAPNPVSLKQITGKTFDLENILNEVLDNCFFWYDKLRQNQTKEIEEAYFKILYRNRGIHSFRDSSGPFEAEIQKVDANGRLHVLTKGHESRKYAFKEVEFLY
jgi:birA, biotin-[acetyl-CoA-carboxylase] ligase region